MDSNYRPQSPDLSSYAPRSPDLSGFHSQGQDLSAFSPPGYSNFTQQGSRLQGGFANHGLGGHFGYSPTSVPQPNNYNHPPPSYLGPDMMPPRSFKTEPDGEYLPDATAAGIGPPSRRLRKPKPDPMGGYPMMSNGMLPAASSSSSSPYQAAAFIKSEPSDPTLGCQLKTSFPVARIKRIMQADEDIGKVAQVTPTVVSRALELFMIKLISASAHQARGGPSLPIGAGAGGSTGAAAAAGGGASKGPRRVLAQHLKKAVMADDTFDFLHEIVNKVPDAPTKAAKKETGSDSEDGAKAARKKGKKRKDSMED